MQFVPTYDMMMKQGGTLKNGIYTFYNGKVATSPSGACKACLDRPNSRAHRDTWQWEGPMHVYVKFFDKPWRRVNETDIQLTTHLSEGDHLIRVQPFYGRYVIMT